MKVGMQQAKVCNLGAASSRTARKQAASTQNTTSLHPHLIQLHPQDRAKLDISLLDGNDRLRACESHAFPRLKTPRGVVKCETIRLLTPRPTLNPSLLEQLRMDDQLRQTLSKANACLVRVSTRGANA